MKNKKRKKEKVVTVSVMIIVLCISRVNTARLFQTKVVQRCSKILVCIRWLCDFRALITKDKL